MNTDLKIIEVDGLELSFVNFEETDYVSVTEFLSKFNIPKDNISRILREDRVLSMFLKKIDFTDSNKRLRKVNGLPFVYFSHFLGRLSRIKLEENEAEIITKVAFALPLFFKKLMGDYKELRSQTYDNYMDMQTIAKNKDAIKKLQEEAIEAKKRIDDRNNTLAEKYGYQTALELFPVKNNETAP